MSDQFSIGLLSQMVGDLIARVQALEEQMASLSEPAEYGDEEAAQTYMDGTPVL
jgi:hypothetical protein